MTKVKPEIICIDTQGGTIMAASLPQVVVYSFLAAAEMPLHPAPEHRMPRRHAFTLIEMLVVISLITLLISMLLPSLGQAKYRTRVTECMVNVRSQWQAQTQLADDNQGKFWRHNDYSADYVRSGGAAGSVWEAIKKGRYLSEYTITVCPVIREDRAAGNSPAYFDASWNGSTYAGWDTQQPQILTTYLWFANYQTGTGVASSGVATNYLSPDGALEPTWPINMSQATADRAFITHRISGGPGGYATHNLGHRGLGLAIPAGQVLDFTPDQPVGFADGHVLSRPASDIRQRTVIFSGGIGYYYY